MSILPSNIHRGSSSSSSTSYDSPNPSNHGFLPQSESQPPLESQMSPSADVSALESLRISEPEPSSVLAADAVSDSVGRAVSVKNKAGSSKKVNEYRRVNAKDCSPDEATGFRSERQLVPKREGGFAQSRVEASGHAGSPPYQRANGPAGRRSQMMNGNHLLNFHYDPISRSQPRSLHPPRKPRKFKPYNKDLFLQANYKFVVLDTGNYNLESMDPDKMLQWEDIICLKYCTPYPVSCPICLEIPLCAQITSCGHIFCFPCILRYLLMGEENLKRECWKKCPLCFVMISSKEMYTIDIENVKQHSRGDMLEFVLLAREKDSFVLHQRLDNGADSSPCDLFSKFILTTDVELSVRNAISDLDSWLAKADAGLVDDMEKLPYVCAAMEQLEKRKRYWNERWNSQGRKAVENVRGKTMDGANGRGIMTQHGHSASISSNCNQPLDKSVSDMVEAEYGTGQVSNIGDSLECHNGSLQSSHDENDDLPVCSLVSVSANGKDSYNFYQAVDGQHIILHPLNMKCLLHHYGSSEKLSRRVTGKILELETVTQSETIRKRYRFLSHFPLTATFQFCEIDLSDMLPVDSLSPYINQIKKREKQREQLARKERREKVKAEAVDAYYVPAPNYGASLYSDEPSFSMDDFEAIGSPVAPIQSPPLSGQRSLFSNVARLGLAAGHDSPSLSFGEPQSSTKIESTNSGGIPSGSSSQGVPTFSSVISRDASVENCPKPKTRENGKKGKKPNRVLLSTAGGRRY